MQNLQIQNTIAGLYRDSKNDYLRMVKSAAKSIFSPLNPANFKDVYLAISKEQGEDLVQLIREKNIKNIVEFGTSFGISTLFLSQGIIATGGHIITTELIKSKAEKAIKNFEQAGVNEYIELRIGDAMKTLEKHNKPIDLLVLDGWKNLYMPLFEMLETNFHNKTIIYVDNADMAECRSFLKTVGQNPKYSINYSYKNKVAYIRLTE